MKRKQAAKRSKRKLDFVAVGAWEEEEERTSPSKRAKTTEDCTFFDVGGQNSNCIEIGATISSPLRYSEPLLHAGGTLRDVSIFQLRNVGVLSICEIALREGPRRLRPIAVLDVKGRPDLCILLHVSAMELPPCETPVKTALFMRSAILSFHGDSEYVEVAVSFSYRLRPRVEVLKTKEKLPPPSLLLEKHFTPLPDDDEDELEPASQAILTPTMIEKIEDGEVVFSTPPPDAKEP